MSLDFSPLKAGGVTQAELAALLSVSRTAVCGWVNGTLGVHEARKPKVSRLLRVIEQATSDEKLPLKGVEKEVRIDALKKVLRSYLRTAD
jgi:hypothetical protein